MHAIKKVSIGALICGATLLVIGGASALPIGAGHAPIGASAENAANGLIIQTACGPGGCGQKTPGVSSVPQRAMRQWPGGGGGSGGGGSGWGGGGGGGTTGFGGGIVISPGVDLGLPQFWEPNYLRGAPEVVYSCEERGGNLVRTRKGYRCVQ
jgi:hypothetical protein